MNRPSNASQGEWIARLGDRQALLEGHFLLSSGLHSPRYVQCARLLMDPATAERAGEALAAELTRTLDGASVDAVVGPALGAVIVSHCVARALGCASLFTERRDGQMGFRRGFSLQSDDTVVVVEDAITTGRSTHETIAAVTAIGARVAAIGCLVDRSDGQLHFEVPVASLVRISVPTYPAGSCPLCAAGSTPVKPGSRR